MNAGVDYGLTGKVALVTGGSRGLGRAIAAALLRAGCRVAIVSRNAESLEAGRRALAPLGDVVVVQADVTVRRQVDEAVRAVECRAGPVDILVNNAGVTSRRSLAELTDDHWDEVMTTNVKALLFTCQAVTPWMMRKRWGRIINASSYAAWHPRLNRGVYAASKAAVEALTRAWAGELAPYGITVNAYAPGDIATDMMADMLAAGAGELTRHIALGRIGTPEDVADAVAFLASERAAYITGTVMAISGGKYIVQNPWDAWPQAPGAGP
ncbi:MAG: SDR family NAD(P)-dependent oxidoreductase [Armatimonadota bacterium]|nr:SDR family NAD(P)-dependent oxidoreductase [Armatimonadota bacterium]